MFEKLYKIKEDIWTYLARVDKPIVMYGTGNGADKIIDIFDKYSIKLYGIFASDDFARGQNFRGYTVKKYSDFKNELDDFIVIVSFASQRPEVLENIYRIDSERELYAPEVPVFGSGLWTVDYFNENSNYLKNIYDLLSDELSKHTFVSLIAHKITGKIEYLRACESTEDEVYSLVAENIINKNYIDIGAYTGDTVEKYVEHFGNDMSIYAFEPDEKNYAKLLIRLREKEIMCNSFNVAAWNENTLLEFSQNSGRASSAIDSSDKKKSKIIKAVRVDSVVNERIGFIKIDAEGADINVIEGISEIITLDKPCLKVAAYHCTDDFFKIPKAVLEIKPDFKLYMRHLSYVPGWDTDFIFVY